MELFRRDQRDVVERVRRLVGPDRLEVLYFADAPLRGCGSGAVWTWKPYRLPPARSTVLLLSDLGLNSRWLSPAPSARSDWVRFAAVLSWQGLRTVVLIPLAVARVPSWASQLFFTVSWDRSLTAPKAVAVRL